METATSRLAKRLFPSLFEELRDDGRLEGRVEGRTEARVEALLTLATQRFGAVSPEQEGRIRHADRARQKDWLSGIFLAPSLDELLGVAGGAAPELAPDLFEELRDVGREEGRAEGRTEAGVEILLTLAARRFGAVSHEHESRIRGAGGAQLTEWISRILSAPTLGALLRDP